MNVHDMFGRTFGRSSVTPSRPVPNYLLQDQPTLTTWLVGIEHEARA